MDKLQQFFLTRYLKAPKRNLLRFSFVFMTLGIVLSVGILSAALNLFEGYERSLKMVLLGSLPHITIQKTDAEYISPEELDLIVKQLAASSEIESTTPVITYSVMAVEGTKVRGASLNGYDFSGRYPFPYANYIKKGSASLHSGEIIIGKYLAKELGKKVGDTLKIVYPQLDRISALGIFPAEHNYRVAGIYNSGFYENDRSMLICTQTDAEALLNINPGFAKLELRLRPSHIDDASILAVSMQNKLGVDYSLYPWTIFSAGLLKLVMMEKWLIFIVFCFLVLISGINVISAVATIILDKKNEIAVLKTLGASSASIRKVLSYQVGLVGLIAIILGQVLGALLSIFVEHQGFYHLKGDVYFIDSLTTAILPLNQLIVFGVSATLVLACIYYPLRQIDKLQIIEILRNP
ncbi:MAG: ABC transporter permease [Candidatus Cloacimonas sp.]|jgi:lipoprotein-releasing system permease protein|nr:ABC transporter permease [Candidatus Cloacimonas sp.]